MAAKWSLCFKNVPSIKFRCLPGSQRKKLIFNTPYYLIHTNPHINVEDPLRSEGPNSLLSRFQLWPPGLTKAPIGPGVEKLNLYPQNSPPKTEIVNKVPCITLQNWQNVSKGGKKQSRSTEADLDVEAANRF